MSFQAWFAARLVVDVFFNVSCGILDDFATGFDILANAVDSVAGSQQGGQGAQGTECCDLHGIFRLQRPFLCFLYIKTAMELFSCSGVGKLRGHREEV